MTRVELGDEIVRRTQSDPSAQRQARGWLGVARDLVASVVESGLNLPDAAAIIRGERGDADAAGPAPVATVTLAEIYATQGHTERAIKMVEEVLAREPDHPAAVALLQRLRAEPARRRSTAITPELADSKLRAPDVPAPSGEANAPNGEASVPSGEATAPSAPSVEATAPSGEPAAPRTLPPPPEPPLLERDTEPPPPMADSEPPAMLLDSPGEVAESGEAEPLPPPLVEPQPEPPPLLESAPPAAVVRERAAPAEPAPPSSEALHTPVPLAVRAPHVEPAVEQTPPEAASLPATPAVVPEPIPVTAAARLESEPPATLLIVRTRDAHPLLCWDCAALAPPSGAVLEIECLAFSATRTGPLRRELALPVSEPRGSVALNELDAGTLVRAALGYRDAGSFVPLVIASELAVVDGSIAVRFRPPLSPTSGVTERERALVGELAS